MVPPGSTAKISGSPSSFAPSSATAWGIAASNKVLPLGRRAQSWFCRADPPPWRLDSPFPDLFAVPVQLAHGPVAEDAAAFVRPVGELQKYVPALPADQLRVDNLAGQPYTMANDELLAPFMSTRWVAPSGALKQTKLL